MRRLLPSLCIFFCTACGATTAMAADPTEQEMITACESFFNTEVRIAKRIIETIPSDSATRAGLSVFKVILEDGAGEIAFDCVYNTTTRRVEGVAGS